MQEESTKMVDMGVEKTHMVPGGKSPGEASTSGPTTVRQRAVQSQGEVP